MRFSLFCGRISDSIYMDIWTPLVPGFSPSRLCHELRTCNMAYHKRRLFELVKTRLPVKPRLSLVDLARELRIGRHTLERAVKSCTNMRFRQFQIECLSIRADADLTSKSVKEVAFALEYKSSRAFSRAYKAVRGITPSGSWNGFRKTRMIFIRRKQE